MELLGDKNDLYLNTGLVILTFISTFLMCVILEGNNSNYSKIINAIILSDTIMVFAHYLIWMDLRFKDINLEDKLCYVENYLNIFFSWIKFCHCFKTVNLGLYFSMQTFSVLSHLLIMVEIINTLKNPISPIKKRIRFYLIISFFFQIVCFSLETIEPNKYDEISSIYDYIFSNKNWAIYMNISFFILSILIGVIAFVTILIRFYLGNSISKHLMNKYVIRQIVYFVIYYLIISPYYINDFLALLQKENKKLFLEEYALTLHFSQVIIMFFIRALNTNFYYAVFCCKCKNSEGKFYNKMNKFTFLDLDQPLTAVIARTLNYEFLTCLLYGLSSIFDKIDLKYYKNKNITVNSFLNEKERSNHNSSSKMNKNSVSTPLQKLKFRIMKNHAIFYQKTEDNDTIEGIKIKTSLEASFDASSLLDSFNSNNSFKFQRQDATIIEYNPKVFRMIREHDNITVEELLYSLDPKLNMINISRIKESEGKSGSFFFNTHNNKFLIKTLSNSELNTLLGKFIERYYDHVCNNETLLTKIYGVYTVVINKVSKLNILFMQNLNFFPKSHIKRIFDLKGSTIERNTKNLHNLDKFRALKDLDFLWMTKVETKLINFTVEDSEKILSQLKSDLSMLRDVNIMDYSLLLIVIHFPDIKDSDYENIINNMKDQRFSKRVFVSKDGNYIYCLGLIDYLQKFNVIKFLENKIKRLQFGDEIKNVSAVDPIMYASRMFNFAQKSILN